MPIEIKELQIKVKIQEEVQPNADSVVNFKSENFKMWSDSLVKECVAKVLEKIKEKQER